ncbi:MAG TPA: hypothetical protein VKA94_13745 [Hyphomicrobiales bacterium]|nr:hypothetical protein [Hyphomicrobiales bacterium]
MGKESRNYKREALSLPFHRRETGLLLAALLGIRAGFMIGFGAGASWLGFAFRLLFHHFSLL